ncbi:MAG: phospholipase D-like domain-containing protein [Myxococcaceae bacterium]
MVDIKRSTALKPTTTPTTSSPSQPATSKTPAQEAPKPAAGWGPKGKPTPAVTSPATPPSTGFTAAPATPAKAPVVTTPPQSAATASTSAAAAAGPAMPKNIDEAFDTMPCTTSAVGEVRRHTDNVGAWNMKWDIVTSAKKTIDFSYFSIERDAYGYAYMGALLQAQMKGVQVTGITDYMANSRGHGFVSAGLGGDYMQELAQYGAKIGIYDKPQTRLKSLIEDGITYKAISSDHDKLAVADAGTPDAMGETGGRNVAGAYHQDPKDNPKSWRDDSIQMKGADATKGLVTALRREMDGPAVTLVKKDLINIDEHATEMLGAFQVMDKWIKSPPLSDAEKAAIRADPKKREALATALADEAIAAIKTMDGIPDRVRNKKLTSGEEKNVRKWASELANDLELKGSKAAYDKLGGYEKADVKIIDQVGAASAAVGQRTNDIAPALFHLINGAQKEIVIQNPYVVLTEDMMKALEAASKRGVNITIVTNSPASTDSAVTQGFFLNDWKKLEERVPSTRIFVATGERKFHAKAFVVDGKVSGDTSYNADLLSGMVNGEVGAVTRSESVAKNLMGHIYDDLADPANNFKEWTIKRDPNGNVVHGADGQPVADHGPEQDISKKLQRNYKVVQFLCDALTKVSLGAPLAHPSN